MLSGIHQATVDSALNETERVPCEKNVKSKKIKHENLQINKSLKLAQRKEKWQTFALTVFENIVRISLKYL